MWERLVQTVDDPLPHLNGQIARWFRSGRLSVAGVPVADALVGIDIPILNIFANRDGIVPPAAARSIDQFCDSVDHLEVGTEDIWFAHADMFINNHAERLVFKPMANWLLPK